jgi:hypothetical protein
MKSVVKSSLFCLLISIVFTACQKDIVNNVIQYPPIAEAGPNQVIQLPSSVILAGSGTSTNGLITGYLWSLITGPNVPVINSPSSPSTTVTNLMAGTYRFQFMVVDQAGLTGIDTVSIQVNPAAIQTLTLQPANNVDEIHLGYWNGDYTNRADVELAGCAWTSGGDPLNTRGLFKFDLSSIPATATILTAKLSIYSHPNPLLGNFVDANYGPNNALYLERVTTAWAPATVTWLTQPATDIANHISLASTNQSFLDLTDIDVKSLVATMTATNNYGFMLRLQNEVIYNIRVFASSRFSDASKRPKLVITNQ